MTDGHDGGKHGISWSGSSEPTPPTETQATRIAALEAQLEESRIRVHDLETNCDPAGNLQQIASLKEQVGGLLNRLKETNNGFLSIEDASVAMCSHCGFKYDPQNATTGCPMCQTMSIGNWAPTKAHTMMSALCNCDLLPNEHEVCEQPVAAPTERVAMTTFEAWWNVEGDDVTWAVEPFKTIARAAWKAGQAAVAPSPAPATCNCRQLCTCDAWSKPHCHYCKLNMESA